ncbi:MAG: hypothetical protein GVY29_02575 [Spirochaetes bacterium]|jgi:hypothetical protein|nr:hypothetical protein [Spirochaetota bacterium]
MKKLSLFLVVFLVLGSFAFGQEEEAMASPLTATGSLSFSLGDSKAFEDTTTDLPVFSSTKAATATLGLATADEKVTGSVSVNLLAPVTVSSELDIPTSIYDLYNDYADITAADYKAWINITKYVDFWNANYDATFAAGANSSDGIFGDADAQAAIQDAVEDALNDGGNGTELADADSDVGSLTLNTPVAPDATAGEDEFAWTTDASADVNNVAATVVGLIQTEASNAIVAVIEEGSDNLDDIINLPAYNVTTFALQGAVSNLSVEDIESLEQNADDIALLKQALDLEKAYNNITVPADPSVTTTVTAPAFITSATLSLNQIGGVVDATFLFGGQHVSAGSINVDGFGHTSTAVKAYHGMTLGLSSGVVEGANASLGLYIDDNGVKASASDDFSTWTDESQAVVDPVYGMTLGGGYSTEVAGLTAGGNLAFGLYDLLGTPAWAVSVMPSVSGMGGSADLEIAYGLDLFYTKAALSYGIMGITPTATIHFISETGDNALAYAATPTSVLGNLKATGGFGADLGLAADLGQFLPVASSINAGLDMGFPTGGELEMAWSAGLSVTPLTGLTASASFGGDEVAGNFTSDINWSTGLSYTYGIATVSASVGRSYAAATGATTASWSLGTSVSF